MYTEVGQQVARFAMRDDHTMFLFIFADEDPAGPRRPPGAEGAVAEALRSAADGNVRKSSSALDAANDLCISTA